MGAKIHRTVSVEAFIREFDLVSVGKGSSISYRLHCRKYGIWSDTADPMLSFRAISIEEDCAIKGMVSPGCRIGFRSYVEKLSVVAEGVIVPKMSHVEGNPAYVVKQSTLSVDATTSFILGLLKMMWMVLELYFFFGLFSVGQYLFINNVGAMNWRYAELVQWPLMLLWFSVAGIVSSIVLKWVMIGKRRPGPFNDSVWRKFIDWAVDWHFVVTSNYLVSLTHASRFWKIVMRLHGLGIDLSSTCTRFAVMPSTADLIKIRNSFVSRCALKTKSNNCYHLINIENSSVGYMVEVLPKNDLTIAGAVVPPLSKVSESIVHQKISDLQINQVTMLDMMKHEIFLSSLYVLALSLLICTLIPPYELWMVVFGNPNSISVAVFALACAMIVHTLVWTILIIFILKITFLNATESGKLTNTKLYMVQHSMISTYQHFSCLLFLQGSPAFNMILSLLGVQFKGRAILNHHTMYEFPLVKVADKTVSESSHVAGHYVVYDEIHIGPSYISGTLREFAYVANANVTSDEVAPLRAHVGIEKTPDCFDGKETNSSDQFMEKSVGDIRSARYVVISDRI